MMLRRETRLALVGSVLEEVEKISTTKHFRT